MKKTVFFVIFYLLFIFYSHSQNFSLDGSYPFAVYSMLDWVTIKGNVFTLTYADSELGKRNVDIPFKFIHIDGIPFIKFPEKLPKDIWQSYFYHHEDVETDDKMLVLAGKTKEKNIMIGTTKGLSEPCSVYHRISEIQKIYKDCTSFLTEGNRKYTVDDLDNYSESTPWVEGAPGYGIGESFVIENTWHEKLSYLLIMNGYISYDKPYLYKQNGRIKQIKVTGVESGKEKILNVLDTPHPQTVDISFITEPEDIKITIFDVYKGTKYEDTCINYMITWREEIIPYEDSIGN